MTTEHPLHEHLDSDLEPHIAELLNDFLRRDDLVVVHRRPLKDYDVFSFPADMEYAFIKRVDWERIMGEFQ